MEQLSRKATVNNVNEIIDILLNKLETINQITKKSKNEIRIICEEILINIVNYAYIENKEVGKMTIKYDFDIEKKQLLIDFIDYGIEFNPLEKENPDINADISERKIGGLGIFIVKQMVDEIEYIRINGTNILKVKKKWG